jgi:hypothetical protein
MQQPHAPDVAQAGPGLLLTRLNRFPRPGKADSGDFLCLPLDFYLVCTDTYTESFGIAVLVVVAVV